MKVGEVMSRDVVTISPDANLAQAAILMRKRKIGFLPVVEWDALLGVLTDRNIVIRSIWEARDPLVTHVKDFIACWKRST